MATGKEFAGGHFVKSKTHPMYLFHADKTKYWISIIIAPPPHHHPVREPRDCNIFMIRYYSSWVPLALARSLPFLWQVMCAVKLQKQTR